MAARKSSATKKTATSGRKHAAKRELIEPHAGDKRYIRRDEQGQFTDSQDDVGRSLAADRRQHSKTTVKSGQGDRGDQKRS